MSMPDALINSLCEAFTGQVDSVSLHTGNPGTTGANDSEYEHASLSWTTPSDGASVATADFDEVVGDYPYIGLWEGETFRQGIELRAPISYTTGTPVSIMIAHTVLEETG